MFFYSSILNFKHFPTVANIIKTVGSLLVRVGAIDKKLYLRTLMGRYTSMYINNIYVGVRSIIKHHYEGIVVM